MGWHRESQAKEADYCRRILRKAVRESKEKLREGDGIVGRSGREAQIARRSTQAGTPRLTPPRRSDRPLQIVGRGEMQVQERGPGFRQHPFKNSDRPEEVLSQGDSVGAAARLVPPSSLELLQTAVRHQQPETLRLSQLMPEPTIISTTNCTVSSVDVQVPWANVRECGSWVRIPSRCWALGVGRCSKKLSGLPVCIGGMKSRPLSQL
jgi:hypothetical protein